MKKLLLAMALMVLFAGTAAADETKMITGAKFDAPNLIKITKNFNLGLEGGKEMHKNLFFDNKVNIEDDKGYYAMVKVTYTGTLFSFVKK